MNQIKRTNSVAVHVRRGDYLNKNNKKSVWWNLYNSLL